MKKMILFILIMMFVFVANANATNSTAFPGSDDYSTFEANYKKGIQPVTINSRGQVTLYGYSNCQSGSCTYKYSNTSPDFKEVLAQTVKCAGGEKDIAYSDSGGGDGYKNDNKENYIGEVYWTADFDVVCTSTPGAGTIQIQQTVNNDGSGSSLGSGGSGSDYGSSSNIQQDSYGVETYYVILVIVGILTYLLTIVIKKQNLFKKV